MAPSRNSLLWFKIAVTLVFISSLLFLPSKSGGTEFSSDNERKMALGSKPPGCVNKCLNCRPCMATLIIPPSPHKRRSVTTIPSSSHIEDDSYYLLSWKCRCRDKLFQP